MPVIHAPESAFAKEMARWEAHYTQYGPPGRPWGSPNGPGGEFPKMIYKAIRQPDGSRVLENFIVNTLEEQRNMESRGYHDGQQLALDALDREHTEHGKLAAELNAEARKMSPQAAQEIAAAQEAHGLRHMPTMPEAPKKRRGRPAKVASGQEA